MKKKNAANRQGNANVKGHKTHNYEQHDGSLNKLTFP